MKLNDILEQVYALADTELPQFNQTEILEAIISDKPLVALKNVFPRDFYPKVVRWLERKLKDIEVSKEAENEVGGTFKAKLDKYLEKETVYYESNAEALVRELISSYEEWDEKVVKPKELPDVKL